MTSFYPLILEAALRALLAAVAVWIGLRLLRVANVLVLKAAWALVLVAAFALPLAPNWLSLPAWAALKLPWFSATPQVAIAPTADLTVEKESAVSQAMIPAATDSDSGRYSSPAISDSHSESAAVAGAMDDPSPETVPADDAVMSRPKSYTPITPDPAAGSQKPDRFPIRRSLARSQAGFEPIIDCLLRLPRLSEMMGQQFRLGLGRLRKSHFEHLANARVELLSLALDEGVVQSVFNQGVLEDVAAARRPPLGIQDFCLRQVGQFCLKSCLGEVCDRGK